MDKLIRKHRNLIKETKLDFQRYLLYKLPWNERLIGIKGARGIGKTTMLLQYIKKEYGVSNSALYITLDDLYFTDNKLVDFVDDFVSRGGEHLFIDEVHKYKNWSIEIKNIYDTYPKLRVVFTGSSLLEILNSRSDLSRRALVFNMQGLSYREYLNLYYQINLQSIDLEDILSNHELLAFSITDKIKPLQYFNEYLKTGYFPFYSNNEELYYKRLQEIINMIIEIELPQLRNTDVSIIGKVKQLLYVMSQSVPFKPNISALANKIQINRKTLMEYIVYLEDASILKNLRKDAFGVNLLQKPEKIFLENTNYLFSIKNMEPNIGSIRETFVYNQLSEKHDVTYPDNGDFKIDNKYIFEIGGKDKTKKQIVNTENSYVVADNIESGFENKIPLWLFGFLY